MVSSVLFYCNYCNYSTSVKGNYKRHLDTDKHYKNKHVCNQKTIMSQNEPKMSQCEPKMSQCEPVIGQPIDIACKYCGKVFKTQPNKRRHELHRCRHKDAIEERKTLNYEKEIKELKKNHMKTIEMLLSKVGTTNIITTNNSININSYGKEDLSHITETFKTNMLNAPYSMIPKMIEHVHFNENKPENQNIQLPNKKENKIKIFSNNRWIYKKKDDIINDLIDGKYFIMDTHYETICNKLKNSKYEHFRTKFDNKDKEVLDLIKEESELVILNNR